MLQNLRQHAQGWIAGVIVTILCLAFAFWGVEYYISQGQTTPVAAKVNGVKITQDQWDAAYKRMRQQQNLSMDSQAAQQQVKKIALNKLIAQEVLQTAALHDGFSIDNTQLGEVIAQTPEFQENGQFSARRYQLLVHELFPSEQDFLQALSQDALIWQVKTGIEKTAFALPAEVDRVISLVHQKRDLDYLLIPVRSFINAMQVPASEIKNYYQTHQNQFLTPEQISVQYVQLSPNEVAKKATVTEAEINQYYQENTAAFTGQSLTQAAPSIEKMLHQQKVQQMIADKSDQLANLSYTNPDTLSVAAQATDLPIQTSEFFSRETKTGLAANPKVLLAAFSDNVLKQGNNSDIIPLSNNEGILVLRVNQHKLPVVRPLPEVASAITELLKAQAAQKKIQILGEAILAQLKQGQSLAALSVKHNLVVKHVTGVEHNTLTLPAEIAQLAFSIAAPTNQKANYSGKTLANANYAIVAVTKVENAVPANMAITERERIKIDLAQQLGQLDYLQYVTAAMNKAKIKYK